MIFYARKSLGICECLNYWGSSTYRKFGKFKNQPFKNDRTQPFTNGRTFMGEPPAGYCGSVQFFAFMTSRKTCWPDWPSSVSQSRPRADEARSPFAIKTNKSHFMSGSPRAVAARFLSRGAPLDPSARNRDDSGFGLVLQT